MTSDPVEPTEDVMLRVLRRPAVRACIVAPVVVLVVSALAGDRVGDSEVFLAMTATALVLALVGFVSPWDSRSDDPAARSLRGMWLVAAGTVGIALLPPVLVVALDVEVQLFSPVIATVLVVGIYAYPTRLRWPLTAWALGVWLITLLWSGVTELGVLVANLAGGLLVVAATVRVADGLVASLTEANRARQESERRASLLSTVLRTNSLDPQDVLRATTTGLMETGLDVAVIRSIDHERGTAVLVDGVAREDLELREEIPIDDGPIAVCLRERRRVHLDRMDDWPSAARPPAEPLQGYLLIPLFDGDEVVAVAAGASTAGRLSEAQVEAAELLAAQAGQALARARRFEADRRTLAELRRLDVRTQDFVSTVSHELRTPLTVIHGLGRTLLARWDDLDGPRRSDLLRRISANAERLSAMVRSLLDTSTLESGEFELERVVVPLRPSVDALLHRLASVTAAHPVTVVIDPELQVEVDPNLFEHVLENLLTNVAKHTPQGTSVELRAEVVDGDLVEVSVTDEGPGIAATDVPHVLDRFYRGGEPDRRPSGGLGLGLALSNQIVQAHGSQLRLTSDEGAGARFSFEVPAAR